MVHVVRDPDRSSSGYLVGEVALSIRCQETFAGLLASALCVTKTRPADVVAHSVPWSALFRAIQEIAPPVRSEP